MNERKLAKVGPGGMKCHCCGPSLKDKRAFLHGVKRGAVASWVRRIIKEQTE